MHCARADDISDLLRADVLAGWLTQEFTHRQLADEVGRLFRRVGPALPRRMRRDHGRFLEDRSAAVLAECLALNEEPTARSAFVAWCREMSADARDPYRCFGVAREDFCAERGPGHGDGP